MRSHQGEAILVVLDRLQGNRPAAHVVTTLAVGAHLAAMDVGMTVSASCAGVGEHHLGMASGARYTLVRSDQGIAGLVVIEFRNGSYRFPADRGMAVLTGDLQSAMRAPRGGIILPLSQSGGCRQDQERQNCARAKYARP